VKEFLVSKGIAEDKIETSAVGQTQQLDKEAVNQLQTNNPNLAPESHVKNAQATWLAYNRRVDIILNHSQSKGRSIRAVLSKSGTRLGHPVAESETGSKNGGTESMMMIPFGWREKLVRAAFLASPIWITGLRCYRGVGWFCKFTP
jgi:hypothetical protein